MKKFLKTDEAAQALRTPVETLRWWRHVGRGPKAYKVGRRVLYDEADLEAWLAEQMRGGDAR